MTKTQPNMAPVRKTWAVVVWTPTPRKVRWSPVVLEAATPVAIMTTRPIRASATAIIPWPLSVRCVGGAVRASG